jgi:hypothetical protein
MAHQGGWAMHGGPLPCEKIWHPPVTLLAQNQGRLAAMRTLGLAVAVCSFIAHEGAQAAPPTIAPSAQNSPVVVAIVVDQLASWVLRERLDALPTDGGFARLRREGRYFQEMAFEHAITETAPGHTSLFTGKVPRAHGVVANSTRASRRPPARSRRNAFPSRASTTSWCA